MPDWLLLQLTPVCTPASDSWSRCDWHVRSSV